MSFAEITDVRDGLHPSIRQTLSILKETLPENRFRRSSKVLQVAADTMGDNAEAIYDVLVDTTSPRSAVPLIDGLGNFGFPPAHPDFSEIKLSNFYMDIVNSKPNPEFRHPLAFPIPYVLVGGTLGYFESATKIPTHNLGEVIDATIALIQNPQLKTSELLQFISGPDLLVGGTIENPEELCGIYESGEGIIKVIVTPETINSGFFGSTKDYGAWYGMKSRKVRTKDAHRLEIYYRALLNDGTQIRIMSLKDILQSFIDFYKTTNEGMSDKELCSSLLSYKELSSARMTRIASELRYD